MKSLLNFVARSTTSLSSALLDVALRRASATPDPKAERVPVPVPVQKEAAGQSLSHSVGEADLSSRSADGSPRDSVLARFSRLAGAFSIRHDGPYVFDPEDLRQIARVGMGLSAASAMDAVHRELRRRYPGRISENIRFILNDAGASLGQVALLHASPSEYVAFFGSPISTGGYSGRYDAEVYDVVLSGEMHGFSEGEVERTVFRPGEMRRLARREAGGYRLPDQGWMLEYARGNIARMFPFGVLAPSMFLTLDWTSAWAQISDFAVLALQSAHAPGARIVLDPASEDRLGPPT